MIRLIKGVSYRKKSPPEAIQARLISNSWDAIICNAAGLVEEFENYENNYTGIVGDYGTNPYLYLDFV